MAAATLGTATAWILTYLIHSSLLIGLALILSRRLGERRLALQEMLIRAAVVGAIATSTIQFSADIRPYSGRFDISGASTRDAAALPPVFDLVSPIAAAPAATLTAPAAIPTPPLAVMAWELGFVVAWLIGAFVGLVRLVLSRRQLDVLLRLSSPLSEGPLIRTARSLARSLRLQRVRFSSSPAITAPFTTGWRRPQICFPHQALHRLPLLEQEGLCAHELAHAARRDAAWLALYRGIEAVFFFQPLNGWARARLQELAECLADDKAASFTRNRLALARSLVAVAEWTTGTAEPALAVGALSSRSALGRRVERLMVDRPVDVSSLRGVVGGSVLILFAAILIVPGVSASSQALDEPRRVAEELTVESVFSPPAPPAPPKPVAAAASPVSPAPAPLAPMSAQEPEPPAAPAPPAPVADVDDHDIIDEEDEDLLALREAETVERLHEIEAEMERVSDDLAERVAERAAEIAETHDSTAEMEAALAPTLAEMAEVEAHTEALAAARIATLGADAEALVAEMAEVAEQQAALAGGTLETDGAAASMAETQELRAVLAGRHAEMREQMARLHQQFEPSRKEMQQLQEQARVIAEAYRPTREQMEELRELSRQLREAMRAQREELRRLAREARELTRGLREQAHRTRSEERLHEREREREERERAREERSREREESRRELEKKEETKKKLEKR